MREPIYEPYTPPALDGIATLDGEISVARGKTRTHFVLSVENNLGLNEETILEIQGRITLILNSYPKLCTVGDAVKFAYELPD